MANPKILFFDTKPYDRDFFDVANQKHGFEITYLKSHLTPETATLTKGFDAICAFVNDELSKSVLATLHQNQVKLIALRSAGYNNVDLKSAFGRIHVVRVPAYSPYAVAEHAAALILSLNRKIHKAYYRTRDNNFTISGLLGFDMYGKTAGVIGTGKIGKVFIDIMKGLGLRVLAYDAFPDPNAASQQGFTYVELDDLYQASDIISLHCPLTPQTVHIINVQSIGKMKDGVMIINTGRGRLIDTKDLVAGLKSNKIGAAGLDVYEEESDYFFEDFSVKGIADDVLARLLTFPNVLITSHQGFFTTEALAGIAKTTLDNTQSFFAGEPLQNEICYKCDRENCRKKKIGRCF